VSRESAELARRLSELKAELARTQSVDPTSRELLEQVQQEIENVLDAPEEGSLRARLEAAIQHFETSHPDLTAIMGRVMDQLAHLGI
jgi:DNA-directed RNA polymerase specialized sigma subunit